MAVTTARMRGWETRTFTGETFFHHRAMGTGNRGGLLVHFKQGQKDYSCGNHPVWEVFRAVYQFTGRPYLFRGLLILSGYAWCSVNGAKRSIAGELVEFIRAEQKKRLRNALCGPLRRIGRIGPGARNV